MTNSQILATFTNRYRLFREARTVSVMISMYCVAQHNSRTLCVECQRLETYALERLDKCPFGEGKTACSLCQVHCFKPEMRQKVREVMKYSGPRMIFKHPILATSHLLDKQRKIPLSPPRKLS